MTDAFDVKTGLLRDKEIKEILMDIISNYEDVYSEDMLNFEHHECLIQPTSLDLRVGKLYVPGEERGEKGSVEHPIDTGFDIKPGRTVLIETIESLKIPSDLMGIGFAPVNLALKGILTPTLGHIDPGYTGHLKIVVINMGGSVVNLERGNHIANILLYRFTDSVAMDRRQRKKAPRLVDQQALNALAPVFADFESRAREEARKVSQNFEKRIRRTIWTTTLGTFVVGALLVPVVVLATSYGIEYFVGRYSSISDRLTELEQKTIHLEYQTSGTRTNDGSETSKGDE